MENFAAEELCFLFCATDKSDEQPLSDSTRERMLLSWKTRHNALEQKDAWDVLETKRFPGDLSAASFNFWVEERLNAPPTPQKQKILTSLISSRVLHPMHLLKENVASNYWNVIDHVIGDKKLKTGLKSNYYRPLLNYILCYPSSSDFGNLFEKVIATLQSLNEADPTDEDIKKDMMLQMSPDWWRVLVKKLDINDLALTVVHQENALRSINDINKNMDIAPLKKQMALIKKLSSEAQEKVLSPSFVESFIAKVMSKQPVVYQKMLEMCSPTMHEALRPKSTFLISFLDQEFTSSSHSTKRVKQHIDFFCQQTSEEEKQKFANEFWGHFLKSLGAFYQVPVYVIKHMAEHPQLKSAITQSNFKPFKYSKLDCLGRFNESRRLYNQKINSNDGAQLLSIMPQMSGSVQHAFFVISQILGQNVKLDQSRFAPFKVPKEHESWTKNVYSDEKEAVTNGYMVWKNASEAFVLRKSVADKLRDTPAKSKKKI